MTIIDDYNFPQFQNIGGIYPSYTPWHCHSFSLCISYINAFWQFWIIKSCQFSVLPTVWNLCRQNQHTTFPIGIGICRLKEENWGCQLHASSPVNPPLHRFQISVVFLSDLLSKYVADALSDPEELSADK